MQKRHVAILAIALIILTALAGCGGAGSPSPDLNFDQGPVDIGPMDADAAIAADEAANAAKGVSATFTRFFTDSVNDQSWGRWTVENNSGYKGWSLYSTSNTPPKSWIMGGNYWNREDDILTSNSFVITETNGLPRLGLALTFYSRWSIDASDSGTVEYRYGAGPWTQVATFSGGSNPDYPNWTKYYYQLPSTLLTDAQVRFRFNSDTAINGWGFGVDNVTVYQTNLNPPTNVVASDFLPFSVDVSWTHNNAGTLIPDFYDIYRSDTPGGPYSLVGSTPYPGTSYSDFPPPAVTEYYVVRARKVGYDDSINSNEDSGIWIP